MTWMETTADRRADPQVLWPAARSVLVCGINYGPDGDPRRRQDDAGHGAISVYALGRDYHDVLRTRLKALGRWITATHGGDVKVFADTAPVMEKPLAQRAGLGWIGKHTNLVSRRFGSWLFLGLVFSTLELPADPPATDHCGSCDRCRHACPTDALAEPYRIEPRRCLSYLTIEHKGEIASDSGGGARQPRLRLRRLPRRLPLEPLRHPFAAHGAAIAARSRPAAAAISRRSRRRDVPPALRRHGDQTLGARSPRPQQRHRAGQRRRRIDALRLGIWRTLRPPPTRASDIAAVTEGRCMRAERAARGRHLAARTRASWLNASRCRSFGICVKFRASSRHIRWRTDRSSSLALPPSPSKK